MSTATMPPPTSAPESLDVLACEDGREIRLSEAAYRELRHAAAYWRSRHTDAAGRERALKEERARLKQTIAELTGRICELEAELRLRERQLFSRVVGSQPVVGGSERTETLSAAKARGQQPGAHGHGRRRYDHLPTEEVVCDLAPEERCCPTCGRAFEVFPGTEDAEQIEIDVRAYRRLYRRSRYRPSCRCFRSPGLITAPTPAKLIPKGRFGISVWVMALLDKYLFQRPTYRLLLWLNSQGLEIAQGTLTDGMKRLAPLFEPVRDGMIAKNVEEEHWHADETRWLVFEEIEGKQGHHWCLWLFRSPSAVIYVLDPSRSAEVVRAHLGPDAHGIISADRYVVYKSLVKSGRFRIAFCWAHVRRDFVKVATDYPKHAEWSTQWLERIAELYRCNRAWAARRDGGASLEDDDAVRSVLTRIAETRDTELAKGVPEEKAKVLESLKKHWEGLTLFLDHPEIPLDNNEAERLLRSPVVGRKNYYGSGSSWSGQLAATLFSIFQTLQLWKINPQPWLCGYLHACAQCGGRAPPDAVQWLPWNLSPEQRRAFGADVHDTP
jgi:transposase